MSLFETIRGLLAGRDDGTEDPSDDARDATTPAGSGDDEKGVTGAGTATGDPGGTDRDGTEPGTATETEPTSIDDAPASTPDGSDGSGLDNARDPIASGGQRDGPEADPAPGVVDHAGTDRGGSPSPPPERFPEEAAQLVDFWPEFDFDYSRASLVRLDEFLASQFDPSRFRNATFGGTDDDSRLFTGLVIQLGSYYGEVLVRTAGATWTETGAFGWVVALPGGAGEPDGADEQSPARRPLFWPVLDVARDCIRGEGGFATSFDAVVTFLGVGSALGSDGKAVQGEPFDGPVDRTDPLTDVDDPERLADRAAGLVADYPWFDLDYSLASLVAVDRVVGTELRDGGTPVEEYTDGEVADVLGKLGAYVGETLVRGADGEWARASNGSNAGAGSSRRTWIVRLPTGDDADDDHTAHVDSVRIAAASLHTGGSVVRLCEGVLRRRITVRESSGSPGAVPGAAGASLDAPATTGQEPGAVAGAADPGEQLTVAGQAEALAAANPAFDLDFTPESLARLDDLVDEAHGDAFVDVDPADLDASARLVSTALPYACYFGETVRRSHEGAGWADRVERGDEDGEGGSEGETVENGADGEDGSAARDEERFTVAVPGEDGAVGVDALRTAATCLAGNATFGGTYRALLDAR